jgi:glycosyltransferase involved in cell wall biosynthesis
MVVYSYYPMDQRVRREVETIMENGASVDIICARNEKEGKYGECNRASIFRVPMQIKRSGGHLVYFLRYFVFLFLTAAALTRLFIKNRYNVIHVHSIPDYEVFAALIPKLFGAKVILDLHELTPEVFATKFEASMDSRSVHVAKVLEKLSVRFADLAISTNVIRRDILMKRTNKKDVAVVMNLPKRSIYGLKNMDAFRKEYELDGKFVVTYVGGLNAERELDVAMKAIKYVEDRIPNICFIYCGVGEKKYLSYLTNLTKELCLDKKVFPIGFVPQEELLSYVAESNVAICPYKFNHNLDVVLATKVFEYLLVPKPVIVADFSAMKVEFKDLVLFYKSSNHEDLGKKIHEVYVNEGQFKEMAMKAQEVLFKKYNPVDNEKRLILAYRNLIYT